MINFWNKVNKSEVVEITKVVLEFVKLTGVITVGAITIITIGVVAATQGINLKTESVDQIEN